MTKRAAVQVWTLPMSMILASACTDPTGVARRADITLADTPAPGEVSVDLLVHEQGCNSGESAEGRIELVELTETADQVELQISVRPRKGTHTCLPNPPTPFTITLSGPLGDREIVDVSVVPPRPVTVDGDYLLAST